MQASVLLQPDKAPMEAMLTLKTVPQKPSRAFGATRSAPGAAPDIWEGDLAAGRAKVYLVGNPFTKAGVLEGNPDPHLQVHLATVAYTFAHQDISQQLLSLHLGRYTVSSGHFFYFFLQPMHAGGLDKEGFGVAGYAIYMGI